MQLLTQIIIYQRKTLAD